MFVNADDQSNELDVMSAAKGIFAPFKDFDFVQNKGAAIFDFSGVRNDVVEIYVDVKCRDIFADAYPNYFVSGDKVEFAKKTAADCYVIYYFSREAKVRIFNLQELIVTESLEERVLDFHHKRADEDMTKKVWLVPRWRKIFEFYII